VPVPLWNNYSSYINLEQAYEIYKKDAHKNTNLKTKYTLQKIQDIWIPSIRDWKGTRKPGQISIVLQSWYCCPHLIKTIHMYNHLQIQQIANKKRLLWWTITSGKFTIALVVEVKESRGIILYGTTSSVLAASFCMTLFIWEKQNKKIDHNWWNPILVMVGFVTRRSST
jgi:hypothetical protein